jgi:hypothetical protein
MRSPDNVGPFCFFHAPTRYENQSVVEAAYDRQQAVTERLGGSLHLTLISPFSQDILHYDRSARFSLTAKSQKLLLSALETVVVDFFWKK